MSGQLPAFLNGSQLVIRIGDVQLAFAQALSFSDNMNHQAVGGLGAFSPHSLEPLQYIGQGSIVVTRWSSALKAALAANGATNFPDPIQNAVTSTRRDGNSLLDGVQFNPRLILISTSFDIDVYQRNKQHSKDITASELILTYQLSDCSLTNYSFNFAPATLLQENVSFMCLRVIDIAAENAAKSVSV
jgi:hypothetical protein